MAELRAYYYNGGDMLELVRCQKENLQKAVGCEVVVFSCEEMRQEERKRRIEKTGRTVGLSYSVSADQEDNQLQRTYLWLVKISKIE